MFYASATQRAGASLIDFTLYLRYKVRVDFFFVLYLHRQNKDGIMLYKKHVTTLSAILAIVTIFNSFAVLSEAEKTFYKDHQNSFAEKVFIENPEKELMRASQLFCDALVFLIPASIDIIVSESCRQGHCLRADNFHKERSFITAGLIGAFCLWLYIKSNKSHIKKMNFGAFLNEYNFDLQQLGDDNLKLYIPKDLAPTLDMISQKFDKNGEAYLASDEFNTLADAIQDEITKNNPAKFDKKINEKMFKIICLTAIALVVMNALTVNKFQRGLRLLQDNLNYWKLRDVTNRHAPSAFQKI